MINSASCFLPPASSRHSPQKIAGPGGPALRFNLRLSSDSTGSPCGHRPEGVAPNTSLGRVTLMPAGYALPSYDTKLGFCMVLSRAMQLSLTADQQRGAILDSDSPAIEFTY